MTLDHIGVIEGSLREGGWTASGNIFSDADRLDWYKAVTSSFRLYTGGAWEPDLRVAFNGHLLPDRWRKTAQSSVAPWQAFTCQEFMKRGRIQGIFFKADASPGNDHQITNMTLANIVNHLLGIEGEFGHCNLVRDVWPEGIAEVDIDTTNSLPLDSYSLKEGNFWQRLQEIAGLDGYLLYVSKDNTIHYVPHPMFGTLPSVTMDFTSAHIIEPLGITPRNTETVGLVKAHATDASGAQYDGVYPAAPTAGPIKALSGIKTTSGGDLDAVAERHYKTENRAYTVEMTCPGAIGLLFEILDRISITYTSSADGITWSAQKFWIENIMVALTSAEEITTTFTLEAENA